VLGGHWPAVVGNWAGILVQDRAKAAAGGVAINDERGGEVWQLQCWSRRQRLLERRECNIRLDSPGKCLTLEEMSEGPRHDAVVPDEFPVVPGEA
jgi:hypothetical protein